MDNEPSDSFACLPSISPCSFAGGSRIYRDIPRIMGTLASRSRGESEYTFLRGAMYSHSKFLSFLILARTCADTAANVVNLRRICLQPRCRRMLTTNDDVPKYAPPRLATYFPRIYVHSNVGKSNMFSYV